MTIASMERMQATAEAPSLISFDGARQKIAAANAEIIAMGEELQRMQETPPSPPAPPEWLTQPLPDLFHSTGIDRFKQEADAAAQMLQDIQVKQAAISSNDMSFLPSNAQSEIAGMNQRVAQLAQRFHDAVAEKEELAKKADPEALGPLNSAIEKMRSQLSDTVSEQNKLNDAMARGDLSAVNESYRKMTRQVNDIERGIRDNIVAQEKFNKTVNDGNGGMDGLLKKVLGIAGAYMGFSAVKDFISSSAAGAKDMISTEQRLQSIMGNINGMTQDGIELVKRRAMELENETAISAGVGIHGQSQLAEYVYDPKNISDMTEAMYNLATETYGAQVSQEQLVQTANLMGKVMLGDINALSRNGFPIDAIFTEAEQKLFKTGTEAERAAMVIEMINENLDGLAQAMAQTPEGQIIRMQNAWDGVKEKIGFGVLPLIGQFSDFILTNMPVIEAVFLNVFGTMIDLLQNVMNIAMDVATFFIENWSWIEPVLWGIVGALTVYLALTNAVAMATRIAAAAQAVYNAILNANPYFLIITLIAAVIVALIALWNKNDAFAAGLMRAWNAILNFFDQVPIFFRRVGNGIVNIFQNMKVGTLQIMENLINGVIDRINGLINMLNKIPGVSIDAIDHVGFAAEAAAEAEAIKQAGEDAVAAMEQAAREKAAAREQAVKERMKAREEARKKAEKENDDKFKRPDLVGKNLGTGPWDVGDGRLPNIDKVKEVGKIKDQVDISSEDIKVMRDLAEMKTIQNFVTLTPTVQITTGDIRNGEDLDSLFARLEREMVQEIESSARAVYE